MNKNVIKLIINDDRIEFLNMDAIMSIDCYTHRNVYIIKILFINKKCRVYKIKNKNHYDNMIDVLSKLFEINECCE